MIYIALRRMFYLPVGVRITVTTTTIAAAWCRRICVPVGVTLIVAALRRMIIYPAVRRRLIIDAGLIVNVGLNVYACLIIVACPVVSAGLSVRRKINVYV